MLTALTANALNNVQLNAGVFLYGFDPSEHTSAQALLTAIDTAISNKGESGAKCLGVTRGGGRFNISRETRDIPADGVRYKWKGSTVCDSVDPYLSTTLLELTPENLKIALGASTKSAFGTSGTKLTINTDIKEADYIENLCWCGDIADGSIIVVHFPSAINTADFALNFSDKGEGELAVEFHGVQNSVEDTADDQAPCVVYLVK